MIYAIGDIHGKFDILKRLYELILVDIEENYDDENTIVFLGDYIDRGKQNRQVLDFLMFLQNTPKINHVFLFGNHEDIFINAMENPRDKDKVQLWVQNGGSNFIGELTKNYYDFDFFHNTFPWEYYVRWMKTKTDIYYETDDYIFVHGGLDIRKTEMHKQYKDYLIWARHTDKDHYKDYNKIVVHGHTPNYDPVFDRNRINVDTSCYNKQIDGHMLTAVALPNKYCTKQDVRFLRTR